MTDRARRRATRLVLLYPRSWRRTYPDFVDVLAAELAGDARWIRCDVVRSATVERLRSAGIIAGRPADRARSGLALVYATLLPFAALATGMWSQLRTTIGGHGLDTPPALRAADLLLAVGALSVLSSLAIAILLVAGHARRRRRPSPRTTSGFAPGPLVRPALALAGSIAALTVGGWVADRSGWYSPAAAVLPGAGPGHLLTLWARGVIAAITPAWVHPGLLQRMPTGELLAVLLAPFATLVAVMALVRLIVRLPVRRPGRADVALAVVVVGTMLLSIAAGVRWLVSAPTTPRADPGHTAWGVVTVLVALTAVAVIGARRMLQGREPPDLQQGNAECDRNHDTLGRHGRALHRRSSDPQQVTLGGCAPVGRREQGTAFHVAL